MKYGIIKDQNGIEHKISKLILGSVPFGTTMSEDLAFQVMDLYKENGGNAIDTARVYCDWLENGHGVSEETVGKWMHSRKCRDEIVLITKGAHPPLVDMHRSRVRPEYIFSDIEESLKALQTDYIDIYFLHRDDERIPVNIIMDTLHELVMSGKVHMIGASNWRAERILEANVYAKTNGKTLFVTSQIQWSYAFTTAKETFKDDTLICMDDQQYQLYLDADIPVMAFSSQALGVFSCGYKPDLSDIAPKHQQFYCKENIQRYQKLLAICKEKNCSPSYVTLNHIIQNELSGFALIGCSKLSQLQQAIEATKR